MAQTGLHIIFDSSTKPSQAGGAPTAAEVECIFLAPPLHDDRITDR